MERTTRGPEPTSGRSWILERLHTSGPVDTMKHHHQRSTRRYTPAPYFKNMFRFCPFWSPKIPRKHQAPPKFHLLLTRLGIFCPDDMQEIGWRELDVCPNGLKFGSRRGWRQRTPGRGWRQAASLYIEHTKGTPPPICGATSALHPHNFSHHKNRKKFAQEDIIFRTENIAKSHPAFGWKNFQKFFTGECFG